MFADSLQIHGNSIKISKHTTNTMRHVTVERDAQTAPCTGGAQVRMAQHNVHGHSRNVCGNSVKTADHAASGARGTNQPNGPGQPGQSPACAFLRCAAFRRRTPVSCARGHPASLLHCWRFGDGAFAADGSVVLWPHNRLPPAVIRRVPCTPMPQALNAMLSSERRGTGGVLGERNTPAQAQASH